MTITVAIPSFNKEKYIERCIKSVLQQREFANEILVVDNCSSDQTFEIAKQFEPGVRFVRNGTNLGMSGNWNRCIELCQSDLLLILHADDELLSGALKSYLDFYQKHPGLGFVHANFYYVQDGDLKTKQFINTRSLEISKAGPEAMELSKGYACSTIVVPKEVYRQVGLFIESMSPDWEMLERIAARYDVGQIGATTAYVHLNNDSAGRRSLTDRSVDEITVDANNLSNKIISYYPPELRGQIARKIKDSTSGLLILVFGRNLKIGQYKKALQALTRALSEYGGFIILVKLVAIYFKRKLTLWLSRKREGV
jgi:glycosyltransferase involved in cell wall biosynthesis